MSTTLTKRLGFYGKAHSCSGRLGIGDQFAMSANLEPETAEAGLRAMKRHALEEPQKWLPFLISVSSLFSELML